VNRRQQAFALHEREIRVQIGERNDHGGAPDENRDALGHASLLAGHLMVLASGLGGSRGGRVEGNLAVSAVLTHFRTASEQPHQARLAASLNRANEVLAARAARDPALVGSGASCGAVLLQDGTCHAARAGDVRIFVVRGAEAEELLLPPTPSPADYARANAESVRFGALGAGVHARFLTTTEAMPVLAGDRLVIVSPGIHRVLPVEEIAAIVASGAPQTASGRLVDAARDLGARGGLSVQVVQYGEPGAESSAAYVPLEVAPSRWTLPEPGDLPDFEEIQTSGRPRIHVRSAPPAPPAPPTQAAPSAPAPQKQRSSTRTAPVRTAPPAPEPVVRITDPVEPAGALFEDPSFGDSDALGSSFRPQLLSGNRFGGLDVQRLAVPVAAAFLIAAVLLIWKPWKSDTDDAALAEGEGPAVPTAAIVDDSPPPAPAGLTELAAAPVEEGEADLPGDPIDLPDDDEQEGVPQQRADARGGDSFWRGVDGAFRTGEPITRHVVTEWLQVDGSDPGSIEERAKARLAELRTLEGGLATVLISEEVATPADEQALDRIFQKSPESAAPALKRFIELEYDKRQEAIFDTVATYVQTHRTPETVSVLLELNRIKTGPKTRAWLDASLAEVLAGP
jgi:serine/threonine protein phosphatase PrpC